jgi:hypothetical protein
MMGNDEVTSPGHGFCDYFFSDIEGAEYPGANGISISGQQTGIIVVFLQIQWRDLLNA